MNYNQTLMTGGQCPSVFRRLTGWLLAFVGIAALAASAHAQTATVTGRVLNQSTGEYLRYAQIQIVGTDKSVIAEDGGVYTLLNVPAGEVKLSVAYTGLDTQEVAVTVPASGTVTQDINLTSAQYGEAVVLGEFKVASAREGNAKAIVEQRVAMNIKTVIAADAFGDVSEGNVGEFLKLLPGVSVDYVDNDVRTSRIRGLPAKYNTITMDGHPIANAASSSLVTGRQLELEQVSMAALDIVEPTKTPTPDMMTPNLGGNVNAVSKSAFNQKGRSIKYQGSVNFNQWNPSFGDSKGWNNKEHSKALTGGKLEWVDTFFDGKLGMVASVANSGSYAEQRVTIGTTAWDNNPDNNGTEQAKATAWNFQHGLKPTWRDSLLLNLDYKVTDDLKLSLRTNYGYYRSEPYNRNWLVNATGGTSASATSISTAGIVTTTTTSTASEIDPNSPQTDTYARYIAQPVYKNVAVGSAVPTSVWTVNSAASANNADYARVLGSKQIKSGGTFIISPEANWKHDNIKVDVSGSYSQAKNAYTSGQSGFFSLVQADMRGVSWLYNRLDQDNVAITQLNTTAILNPNVANTTPAQQAANAAAVLSNQGSIFDLGNYNSSGSVNTERRNSMDQMWTANADVEIDYPDWSIPTTFKFGAADSIETRNIHNFQAKWTMTLTSGPTSATAVDLQDYRDNFGGRVGTVTDLNGVTAETPAPDNWALYKLFESYGNTDPYSLAKAGPFQAQASTNLKYILQNKYNIKENISAAYAMATIKPVKKLNVLAGLRFERTESQGTAAEDKGATNTLLALGYSATQIGLMNTTQKTAAGLSNATTNVIPNALSATLGATTSAPNTSQWSDYVYYRYGSRVTNKKTYSNALPVVQGRYEITKNLIARGAYYYSLMRPEFQNLVGGVTATDNSDGSYAYSINNQDVKAETANNYDLSLEYYFEPVGVVSATVFYKDIKNIQINLPTLNTYGLASSNPALYQKLADAGISDNDLNVGTSSVTTIINGPKTTLWGYELAYSQELSFLPGILKGLGVTANYSHYEPKEKELWALVPNAGDGMALDQGNLIGRYKIGKFKAQASATWTAKRLFSISGENIDANGNLTPATTTNAVTGVTTNSSNSNVRQYLAARWIISANAEYQVHRYASVYIGVNNIFNDNKFQYNEREAFIARNGSYGASINVGVKGSF
jgi:TonB-dependent receptor